MNPKVQEMRAARAAQTELAEMITTALTDREFMISHGETVGTEAEYIAGWLIRNGYSK